MTTMAENARPLADSIALVFDLPHPPEKVWRALTDPDLLAQWLLPVVGADFAPDAAFVFQAQPQPGWDGIVHCRIVEIEAPWKLSYTWVVGDIDTVVSFTLTPVPAGTKLSLRQSGFKPDQRREFGGARYGWKMMTEKLVDLLATHR